MLESTESNNAKGHLASNNIKDWTQTDINYSRALRYM